jgi:ABC-type uncharacterized transport system ATPase subunit
MQGICKSYGRVQACSDVQFSVFPGEVHCLLGENGAGKSTLMKVLVGLVPLDAGEVRLRGRPVVVTDPTHAAALGLVMAHQHFSLIERLQVWENVALAHRGGMSKRNALRAVAEVAERYGLVADSTARVEDLTVGQRQRVELIKCLSLDPQVLILDEPTSVLTAQESREIFGVLRGVVKQGQLAVVLISHKLDEVTGFSDRVTIMRDGYVVETLNTADTSAASLARAMVGRPVLLRAERAALGLDEGTRAPAADTTGREPAEPLPSEQGAAQALADHEAPVALHLDRVTVTGAGGRVLLDEFSIRVRPGEIVGLAGVEGNGQAALEGLMSGLVSLRSGCIQVAGQQVKPTATGLLEAKVGVIPEDRHASGCILDMSIEDNLVAPDLAQYSGRLRLLDRKTIRRRSEELMTRFDITAASAGAPMSSLSGGNQQRVVVARELSRKPVVLVALQPTRGLDVGAIEYMNEQLLQAAADGVGILLVSTELEEILAIAHRVAVIYRGRNVGEMTRDRLDVERLGLLMGGR